LFLTLLTIISCALFWAHSGWLPIDVSADGPGLDQQLKLSLLANGVLFIAAQLVLAYTVWRYRARGDRPRVATTQSNVPLELGWALAITGLVIGLGFAGYRVWAQMYLVRAPSDSVHIAVQGYQFAYSFRYPGADGRFGPVHVDKIDDAAGNPWGLDREHDPESKDDIVTATLAIPLDRPVELLLSARDLGHSFYVRELRIQQDMLPGMEIPIHFTARKAGEYEIVCTQLCGLGHYRMRAFLKAMPEGEFKVWLGKQAVSQ
jgi:cytochrome c oxidase subunit 2